MMTDWNAPGRELDSTPLDEEPRPRRIVGCLNVWNDLPALKRTIDSWRTYVDHIIVVDGAYDTSEHGLSTDGTREFMSSFPNVTLIDAPGMDQCAKRTKYLEAGRSGDYLFIVDADESVTNAAHLVRALPVCDVGWIRVRSSLYTREYGQPRIIRWQPHLEYRGRHHWIFQGNRLLCSHQYGGTDYAHRPISITLHNQRHLGRNRERLQVKSAHHSKQYAAEVMVSATPRTVMSDAQAGGREALQILHIAYRDDGLAPSRLHTAINRTTPHSSLFFKSRPGPFDVPEQFSTRTHAAKLAQVLSTADVLHYHGVMSMAQRITRDLPKVFHHHGSMLRANAAEYNAAAKAHNALVLVSNLELLSWTEDLPAKFLPNTVPVARYRQLADNNRVPFTGSNPFRVAHSPSQPHRKGTDQFLSAIDRLRAKNVPIEAVMIHGMTHRNALDTKATCHASFDSFWLGIQCSGVEAAAMRMPVIAGDVTVADRYLDHFGAIPYTFADNGEALEHELFNLVNDASYYATERDRVYNYVVDNHDESAVALTYLDYLDVAFGWRAQTIQKLPTTQRSVFRGARA